MDNNNNDLQQQVDALKYEIQTLRERISKENADLKKALAEMKLQPELKALTDEHQIFREYESIFMERRAAKDKEIADLNNPLAKDEDDQVQMRKNLASLSDVPQSNEAAPQVGPSRLGANESDLILQKPAVLQVGRNSEQPEQDEDNDLGILDQRFDPIHKLVWGQRQPKSSEAQVTAKNPHKRQASEMELEIRPRPEPPFNFPRYRGLDNYKKFFARVKRGEDVTKE